MNLEYKKVKGFLGTQDIMFLGLNPSYSHFPSNYDEYFYLQLRNNNFEDAHLTDLLKKRATKEEVDRLLENEKVVNEQIDFLIKEIEIIAPKMIVALGNRCFNTLKK